MLEGTHLGRWSFMLASVKGNGKHQTRAGKETQQTANALMSCALHQYKGKHLEKYRTVEETNCLTYQKWVLSILLLTFWYLK